MENKGENLIKSFLVGVIGFLLGILFNGNFNNKANANIIGKTVETTNTANVNSLYDNNNSVVTENFDNVSLTTTSSLNNNSENKFTKTKESAKKTISKSKVYKKVKTKANKAIRHKNYYKPRKSYKPSVTYSSRCMATTKKGTQCKRNAQPGRNYCWQH